MNYVKVVIAIFAFVLISLSVGKARAFTVSKTAGAEMIVLEDKDTILGACVSLFKSKSLPSGMSPGKCMTAVLRKNFSDNEEIALQWAKEVKAGDVLFFPARSRESIASEWLGKIKSAVSSANEKSAEVLAKATVNFNLALDESESKLFFWRVLAGLEGLVILVLGYAFVFRGKKSQSVNVRVRAEHPAT